MAEEYRSWVSVLRAPGIGPRTYLRLLEAFEDPSAALAAPASRLRDLGVPEPARDYLARPDQSRIDADLAWLGAEGNHLVTWRDDAYPPLLREISNPPPLLFVRGDVQTLKLPQLAIVGSRNPSASGRETARELAKFLSRSGISIISGLAQGIDCAAHQGALEAEGPGVTIAVTGTGLDLVYPRGHRELAHRVAESGALVSEFPPGTKARPEHFPRRNRIISGLSLGTLVVEAALRSGSLITARLAAEQGREVFAIPGSIHNPLARGCHSLIRQGAKLVETASDVLEELGVLIGSSGARRDEAAPAPISDVELDADYRKLLSEMGFDPISVDHLVQRTGLTADAVSSMLLLLELEGLVSALDGGRYCRVA